MELRQIFEVCAGENVYWGEEKVGTHVSAKRWCRHILGQPWMKYYGKQGIYDEDRGSCSRIQGESGDSRAGSW